MAYVPPSITDAGLVIPSYSDILAALISHYQGIYGATVWLAPDVPDYQDLAIRSLVSADTNSAMQQVYLGFSLASAVGPQLDLLGVLIGTPRKVGTYSTVLLTITGNAGAVITSGQALDVIGNYWLLPQTVTIPSGGSITVSATAQNIGAVTAQPNTITIIATPTAGWTGVNNAAAATAGNPIEADSAYRARLMISQSLPSLSLPAGTAAGIAAVSGVTRSQVYENPTNATDSNGLPAHSIECVVEGGAPADIAQAIYNNRGIGCYTNGSTTVTVTDPNNGNFAMPIRFDILTYLQIFVSVSVHPISSAFNTSMLTAVQTAVINYLNGLGIGQPVVYGELFDAALTARPDPENPAFTVNAITYGAQAASTTGNTTAGSQTLAITGSVTGIASNQPVTGPGIQAGTTVAGISGSTVTLSLPATATGNGVTVVFYSPVAAFTTIAMPFNKAAQANTSQVQVVQV